jgi:hypothetical protein
MTPSAGVALAVRLQVDQKRPLLSVAVGAIDADERGRLATAGSAGRSRRPVRCWRSAIAAKGDRLRAPRVMPEDQAGVLHREEALRDDDVERNGERQRRDGDRRASAHW